MNMSRVGRGVGSAGLAVMVVGYAWAVSATRPFTVPAEILLVLPGLIAVAVRLDADARRRQAARERGEEPRRGEARLHRRAVRHGRPWVPTLGDVLWVVLIVVAVAWELAALFQGPRQFHPTLSSITNGLFDRQVVKAVGVVAMAGPRPGGDSPVTAREVTLAGYALLLAAGALLHVAGVRWPQRVPHVGKLFGLLTESAAGRWLIVVLWWWLGWHLFVR